MSTRRRYGFTLIELLIVIAIIGLLTGMLIPAVGSAREASRRVQCVNRLRQLGLAVNQFQGAFNYFPPARLQTRPGDRRRCGGREATWLARILPYLEEQTAYDQWDLYAPWHQQDLAARMPETEMFLCPSRRGWDEARVVRDIPVMTTKVMRASCGCTYTVAVGGAVQVEGIASDYAGNHGDLSPGATGQPTDFYYGGNGTGILITSRPKCRNGAPFGWVDQISARHVKDGLSQTILVGEKHITQTELQQFPADSPAFDGDYLPASVRVAGPGAPLARGPHDTTTTGVSFGSWHQGLCNFVFADGSTRSLDVHTSTRVLALLSHRNNGVAPGESTGN